MRFASLGSGSEGNGLLVEVNKTRLLIDCGFSIRETTKRLARLGLTPEDLTGIVVTHEHGDHGEGVLGFACQHRLPVWLTHGTFSALDSPKLPAKLFDVEINTISSHEKFAIRDIEVFPYPVPHDAREPAQYVFSDGARSLGLLTDTGCSTPHIELMLSACHALVLECNHDLDLLQKSHYPSSLKQRIGGSYGHLDNTTSAKLLSALDNRYLQHIIAAHLSQHNNTPELATRALASALNCELGWIGIADQHKGFEWREIV